MKNKLLIIGASGHGKVIADIALKMNKWHEVAFLDDNEEIKSVMGFPVLGKSYDFNQYLTDYDVFVGIGNNAVRKKILTYAESKGAGIPVLIHPDATIARQVNIEKGTVIMAGTVINCCTTIGKGCIINTGSTIDHDNTIADYVHISPGVHLAGSVDIGEETWLGIGSIVSNNISIVSRCKVGAGAVVVMNLTETGTYIGVPARRINNDENFNFGKQ